jgi:membrane protease YdiL (CAAX protease family)
LLRWNSDDLGAVVAVSVCSVAFVLYWFLSHSEAVRSSMEQRYGEERTRVRFVLFQRYAGALLLGGIPALAVLWLLGARPRDYGVRFDPDTWVTSLGWILGLAGLLVPVGFLASRRKQAWSRYPQIRTPVWTPGLLVQNAAAWVAYLLAYEYLFRGMLLFECTRSLGAWPAIAVSTALYSMAHVPKGLGETIGAIPFGVLLCVLTLLTGTLWVAFSAHLLLALANDCFAIHHNPELAFVRTATRASS